MPLSSTRPAADSSGAKTTTQRSRIIATVAGPVGVRNGCAAEPRQRQKVKLQGGKEAIIQKGWLKGEKAQAWATYATHVKQAMLLASVDMQTTDVVHTFRAASDSPLASWTGGPNLSESQLVQELTRLKDRRGALVDGKERVTILNKDSLMSAMVRQHKDIHHNILIKRRKVSGLTTTRYFLIRNGRLEVHKYPDRKDKPKLYNLSNLDSMSHVSERSDDPTRASDAEPWHILNSDRSKPMFRIRLSLFERAGPVYLYTEDPRQAERWRIALIVSRNLGGQDAMVSKDRLQDIVKRLPNAHARKAWEELFRYFREMATLKEQVRILRNRLLFADSSRAFSKMLAVYSQQIAVEERQRHAVEFVKSMICKRMEVSRSGIVADPANRRAALVKKVQNEFRRYRLERIMERTYPLGANGQVLTRTQQAQSGTLMGLALDSMTCESVLRLVFHGRDIQAQGRLDAAPEFFDAKNPTYSATPLPVRLANVQVSESFSMLSFSDVDQYSDLSHLAKGHWAFFINLSQISSVVLNTARKLRHDDKKFNDRLHPGLCGGVWFTINGPRVSWGRRLRESVDKKTARKVQEVVGAPDGYELSRSLSLGQRTKFLHIALKIAPLVLPELDVQCIPACAADADGHAHESDVGESDVYGPDGVLSDPRGRLNTAGENRRTFMVVHLLGRRFQSQDVVGNEAMYWPRENGPQRLEACVPVSEDLSTLAALDDVELSVDILHYAKDLNAPEGTRQRERGGSKAIWAGSMPLWKLFTPQTAGAMAATGEADGEDEAPTRSRGTFGNRNVATPKTSLSSTLNVMGRVSSERRTLTLMQPWSDGRDQFNMVLTIDALAEIRDADAADTTSAATREARVGQKPTSRHVSPELQGVGNVTALYSSHRGAWYDTRSSDNQVFAGGSPNFVELSIETLRFPDNDKVDSSRCDMYHIEARCSGVTLATVPLTRPKPTWKRVMIIDPSELDFGGTILHVPLPPGAWCSADSGKRPSVEICLVRTTFEEVQPIKYEDIKRPTEDSRGARRSDERRQMVYRALLIPEGLQLDEKKNGVQVPLCDLGVTPPEVQVKGAPISMPARAAVLVISVALRDRDYVRLRAPKEVGQREVLCVGDKAALKVEDVIDPPVSELEHRRRCFPGRFGDHDSMMGCGDNTKLREPMLPHEWLNSGLDKLKPKPSTFPKTIPASASEDVVPHRYVLPKTEIEFIREGRPGTYWRIMETQIGKAIREHREAPSNNNESPIVVEELSHVQRHLPVTVLAVYPDHTCDLELDERFVQQWSKRPEKHYSLPGTLLVKRFRNLTDVAMWKAGVGAGDVSDYARMRVALQRVPLKSVVALQATGFNVYDANFASTDDAVKENPCDFRNDVDPRMPGLFDDLKGSNGCLGGYDVHAGPLPLDAGVLCQYEWSLHLCAKTEGDMHRFVTNLRHCMRLDYDEQVRKLDEYRTKTRARASAILAPPTLLSNERSGHLEVVLVEAKHLRPQRLLNDMSVTETMSRLVAQTPNVCAAFTITDNVTNEERVYRGSKVQYSSQIVGDSPRWGAQRELASTGGWTFRSPVFDPLTDDLMFEIKLLQNANPRNPLALVRVPMTGCLRSIYFTAGEEDVRLDIIGSGSGFDKDRDIPFVPVQDWQNHQSADWWSKATSYVRPGKAKPPCLMNSDVVVYDQQSMTLYLSDDDARMQKYAYPFQYGGSLGSYGIDPNLVLCGGQHRFHNLWLPLSKPGDVNSIAPITTANDLVGEIHIYCLWVPVAQTQATLREPTTARGFRAHLARPSLRLPEARLRDDTYKIQLRLRGYNPNVGFNGEWAKSRAEAIVEVWETIKDVKPYLVCLENQGELLWDELNAQLVNDEQPEILTQLVGDKKMKRDTRLADLLRRGVPAVKRREIWKSMLRADDYFEEGAYMTLAREGASQRSEAMLQLQEDMVSAATLETLPECSDLHLHRLSRAQRVCIALIAFNQVPAIPGTTNFSAPDEHRPPLRQVVYSECLLTIAFFLLVSLPSVPDEDAGRKVMLRAQSMKSTKTARSGMTQPSRTRSKLTDVSRSVEHEEADEEWAFWMLFALVQLPAFKDYYCVAPRYQHELLIPQGGGRRHVVADDQPMCDRPGPMEDVCRLGLILARYERDLWVHLQALGFQLASVFYGAFSQLYAFMLPPHTLFRLWDLIFSDATDPQYLAAFDELMQAASVQSAEARAQAETARAAVDRLPPPRRALIDVAFGVLQRCRTDLLNCQSALEARDCIVGRLESIWDPCDLIEMATDVERFLWMHPMGFTPAHTKEYNRLHPLWEAQLHQYRFQNQIIREMVQKLEVELDTPGFDSTALRSREVTNPTLKDRRITTRNVVNVVIPLVQKALVTDETQHSQFGGMHRPTLAKLCAAGPEPEAHTVMDSVSNWTRWAYDMVASKVMEQEAPAPAVSAPRPPGAFGEPTTMESVAFQVGITNALGNLWGNYGFKLYEAFGSPIDHRMSLNEMLAAIICGSRGTVGEKAVALFHLYGTHMHPHRMGHITPVTHAAETVLERIDAANTKVQLDLQIAPTNDEITKMALHFRVFSVRSSGEQIPLGDVYVRSLKPYLCTSGSTESGRPESFPIWAPLWKEAGRQIDQGVYERGNVGQGRRVNRGELLMHLSWTPSSDSNPSVGQLGITIDGITFDNMEAPETLNPRVTVVMYTETGEERQIPRWDPRTRGQLFRSMPADLMLGEAFGDHIIFPETMWYDPFGRLHHRVMGQDHGWNEESGRWSWDPRVAQQFSIEDMQIRPDICSVEKNAPNTISLHACRLVAEGILHRGLHCLTNRQATLLADQIFSRTGAVPGILDAILVQAPWDAVELETQSVARLKKEVLEGRFQYVDVKHQLVLAHEAFVSSCPGSISLFSCQLEAFVDGMTPPMNCAAVPLVRRPHLDGTMSLGSLQIKDPFGGQRKVLLIRFVRSGDGQRFNAHYHVDGNGVFQAHELCMDMDLDSLTSKIQMSLTRGEFVSCFLSSPLLSEALRRNSSFDMNAAGIPPDLCGPIQLEVAVSDAEEDEAKEHFMDLFNVRQQVVFELWDRDRISYHDYLGECTLPAFDNLSSTPQRYLLDVGPPNERSRPDAMRKDKVRSSDIKGTLLIEASWRFPLNEEAGPVETLEQRAAEEGRQHTGELKVTIIKAEGIRLADTSTFTGRQSNDAYVLVYVRNEALENATSLPNGFGDGGWRVNVQGSHEPAFKTEVGSGSDPVWNSGFSLKLQTGGFEKKTKRRGLQLDLTSGQASRHQRDRLVSAVRDGNECVFRFFGDGLEDDVPRQSTASKSFMTYHSSGSRQLSPSIDDLPGNRHGVKVFLGDTIFQFKLKLEEACRKEAEHERMHVETLEMRSDEAAAAELSSARMRLIQYETLAAKVCYRYVVMTFVPSRSLREMYRAGQSGSANYQHQYRVEFIDPSSWQPLDPVRTFMHYAGAYGFGAVGADPQQLRVVEVTTDYGVRNSRYRRFMQDESRWRSRVEELNTPKVCFGYAKYMHSSDSQSIEWRPVLVERTQGDARDEAGTMNDALRSFRVSYLTAPANDVHTMPASADTAGVLLDEARLLLAPLYAKILGHVNLEAMKLLRKAPGLQDRGFTEEQIVKELNDQMEASVKRRRELDRDAPNSSRTNVPKITQRDVHAALCGAYR